MGEKTEKIILVNENDREVGVMEKIETHEKALLHRAFSVFIFNGKGQMLLQQRAAGKYHSPKLWTNACCSHPRQGEDVETAALRRMKEELGFQTNIEKVFAFVYRAGLGNGLTEHEYDHVFRGTYNGDISCFNPEEVCSVRWISMKDLKKELAGHPERFTVWFKIIIDKYFERLK